MPPIQPNFEPIPGYRLLERLGRGGCGEVWKAEAPGGILKAVKFVHGDLDGLPADAGAAEQEYKSLHRVKAIRHPFILSIERFDVVDGQLVIVMELADRSLQDRFNECAAAGLPGVPREELLRYMEEAAEALDLMNAHHQIQHLDVKPQNIFLVQRHVKVADFGLAKDLEGARAALTGGMTPMYAPPETFDGWVSRQTDQYSLAVVYQEMLTGKRPFAGANARQLVLQHLTAPPDVGPLPPADRPAVLRALAKAPGDRFPTCTDFVSALRASGTAPVPAARPAGGTVSEANKKTDRLRRPGPAVLPAASRPEPPAVPPPPPRRTLGASTGLFVRPASAERHADGILSPVFVVGIGGCGLTALRQLRRLIHDRYGEPTLPNFRWLYIDTDPDAIDAAMAGPADSALASDDVLLAPLHPPTHYRTRPELPSIDTRLTADTLAQLPPTPATHGVRGLGRLALRDSYVVLRTRVRTNLGAFTRPDPVVEADRRTKLGTRRGSPRVYLVGSMEGGTGSGMLIDLAYMVRRELRELGLGSDHLVGLFGVPDLSADVADSPAAANARAALTELRRYDTSGTRYEARIDSQAEPLTDTGRPFRRCALLPAESAPAVAAHLVFAETLTAVGRALRPDREPLAEHPCSTVGLRRVLWPQDRLLQAVARRLARDTLAGWAGPVLTGPADGAAKAVEHQWHERRLDVPLVRLGIEYGAAQKLGGPVETLIHEILQCGIGNGPPKEGPDLQTAGIVLNELTALLGVPGNEREAKGRVAEALDARVAEMAAKLDSQLASMVVSLLEQPGQRVAGAREAIRLLEARLSAELTAAEREMAGLEGESVAGYAGARDTLAATAPPTGKSASRQPTARPDFATRVAQWVKTRSRQLRDGAVVSVYRRLLAAVPEYAKEVDLVAHRLAALALCVEIPTEPGPPVDGVGEYLFPRGAGSFEEAVDRTFAGLGDAALREFDHLVQGKIRAAGKGIIHVAVRPGDWGPKLATYVQETADQFVEESIGRMSAGQALVKSFPDREDLTAYLHGIVDSAAPTGPGSDRASPTTVTVLGLPEDSAGQQVGAVLRGLAADASVISAELTDEILVLRECRGVPLASILGPQEAAENDPGAPADDTSAGAGLLAPSNCG
jgi:eukaryotic-like serine/threonine-protein kinase